MTKFGKYFLKSMHNRLCHDINEPIFIGFYKKNDGLCCGILLSTVEYCRVLPSTAD